MLKKHAHTLLLITTIMMIILIIALSPLLKKGLSSPDYYNQDFEEALVVALENEELTPDPVIEGLVTGRQEALVQMLTGPYKGELYETINVLDQSHNVLLKESLRVIVGVRETDEGPKIWVYNHKRVNYLYLMAALFFITLLYFGGRKGLDSIVALLFTASVFIFILVPLIFRGYPTIILSIVCALVSLVVSFLLIGGFEKKTYVAIMGTVCGIIAAGLVSYIFSGLTHISGINLDKGPQLVYVAMDYGLKVKGLMFASILIASLGAVMDVAMSISSSMQELHKMNPKITFKQLFKTGMTIGKDIMGTMANTLILAFMGGSFSLMLLLWGYNMSYRQISNLPFISVEVVQGLAGSIGIVLTVPFTALMASFFYLQNPKAQGKVTQRQKK